MTENPDIAHSLTDDDVLHLLTALSPDQRVVIAAALINRLDYLQIAQRFGMSGDQTKRHMREALEILRQNSGSADSESLLDSW